LNNVALQVGNVLASRLPWWNP